LVYTSPIGPGSTLGGGRSSALVTKGYFDDLEKTLKSQSDSNTKGGAAEFDRTQKELKDIQNRITSIWTNQSRMQLSEDALKLASDELNRLAKQKQDLEKYLSTLDPKASDPFTFKEQTLFVENQIRWCMQGWAKATPAMRKRLLRRTIKEIVVTQTELLITFWTNSEDRDFSLKMEPQGENSNDESNIISFGRRKRPAPNANERRRATSSGTVPDSAAEAAGENLKCAVGENQNSSIRSSGNDKIGRREVNILKPTELSIGRAYKVQWKKEKPNLEELARLYWVQGLSQVEIARLYKIRRATISAAVKKFQPVG